MNEDKELLKAATFAAAVIRSIYEHLERVEKLGGATSIPGIAACNTMLKSMRSNAPRVDELVLKPLNEAIERAKAAS